MFATLKMFLKENFENVNFEKSQQQKHHKVKHVWAAT